MEKKAEAEELEEQRDDDVKLDKHGLPLEPQPSSQKNDPLVSRTNLLQTKLIGKNWSPWLKFLVLMQVSFLAMLGPMGSAVANPAFVLIGKAFNVTVVQASYILMVYILFAGVGPLFTVPFANVYGRRPIYLLGNLLAGVTNVIAGNCTSWSGIIVTRVFNGIGAGSPVAIGAATICDMYYLHERGFYMGIYTFFLTNGPHLASLLGGFIAQNLGWRYCYTVPGYIQLGVFVITLFLLPETLFPRKSVDSATERSYTDLLLFRQTRLNRKLRPKDFVRPLSMARYVCVVVPALYYMTCFGYGSVIFAQTGSAVFSEFYHFNTAQTGLMLSIPLLVGCLIGEANAGWFTDWMVYRYAKRHGGKRIPEPRLDALWFALCIPVGLIIQGVCISHAELTSWVGNAFGMGIASLGLQVATTVTYAYCTDCYKPQSPEISGLLNVFRQVFSAVISFYAIPLASAIQYQYAWLVFAMINLLFLVPMLWLRFRGERIRAGTWQSPPTFHNDI